jgi:hypothetical protein
MFHCTESNNMRAVEFHKVYLVSVLQTTKNKPVTTKMHGVTYFDVLNANCCILNVSVTKMVYASIYISYTVNKCLMKFAVL